ncbi:MAG: hypothetical protein ACOCRX_00955, partial [Candidatus Woesearchaeota archaeon]
MQNKQSLLYLIPKSSYYNSEEKVIKEGLNLHNEMFKSDRVLYSYLLYFNNSTYYSKSLIIERLLANSLNKPQYSTILKKDPKLLKIEDELIIRALRSENITHALKMLLHLKKNRINNSRTQNIILKFLFERNNLDYIAIKYK